MNNLKISLLKPRPLFVEFIIFLSVNVADVILTYILLTTGSFEEANGVARNILYLFGFKGLIIFKYSIVLGVGLAIQAIATKDLTAAKRVIRFGICVVGCVDIWSSTLLVNYIIKLETIV